MRTSRAAFLAIVLATTFPASSSASASPAAGGPDTIRVVCRVFQDTNADGVRQAGEPGLAGVRLTNGVVILPTDAAGERDVVVDRAAYRFATLSIPAGFWPTTPWFHHVPPGAAGPDTVEFGLRARPETATDPVRWVHIADTQLLASGAQPWTVSADLETISRLGDPPLFVMNAGDLVEVGSDTTHWENYVDQLTHPDFPVFAVPGNHDVLGVSPPMANYERYVGPPYYDFEAGSWVFIGYNSEVPAQASPQQDAWLEALVAALPPGKHLAVFQHRMLSERNAAIADRWAALGVRAAFSGHWHSLQFTRHKSGILDFNVSRSATGPLDRTPRGFGAVTCLANGEVDYELRRFAVDHRAEVTHPVEGQALSGDPMDVFVQAYDTTSPVTSLTASVSGDGGSAAPVALAREGVSLWRGAVDLSALPEGYYNLAVSGSFRDGTSIALTRGFERRDVVPIVRSADGNWPMFRKNSAGSGFVARALEPPLEVAWATAVPGMVALSSPVVDAGRVFLGCRSETEDMAESGVLCCDALTGERLWFTPLPSGVALAPAVAGDVVIVTAMADSAFGLDVHTGARVWSVGVQGKQYQLSAPVVTGDEAWVGSEPRIAKVRAADGTALWTSGLLGSNWHPYIYSAPAIGADFVYLGYYGDVNVIPDGFSVLDRGTGAVVHQENGVYRSPIWAGDRVYVVGGLRPHQQVLTAREPSGGILWQAAKTVGTGTGSPALGHGVLVVASEESIVGFRAADGADLWSRRLGFELQDTFPNRRRQRHSVGAPAISDSTVYAGSTDGHLYALDLLTGAELWKWYFGTPVSSSPAVSGNMLFIGNDGHLYGFAEAPPVPPGTSIGPPRAAFAVLPPRPNPSRSVSTIAWVQPRSARARVEIFDVRGRRVRLLVDESRDPGVQQAIWDGLNDRGRAAAPGVYFVRVRADADTGVRRLVRLR